MTLPDWNASVDAMRAERNAALAENARLRAAVERVLALHEADAEVQDIHGELICKTCGMRQGFPCATARALAAPTADDARQKFPLERPTRNGATNEDHD